MLKKIITFLFFFLIVFLSKTFAVSIPVEQVFTDIDKNYKYYNELQVLYDKWMIFPDNEWKLNPNKFLNRDEFVWIMMEVSCEKCISPNVSYDLFKEYNDKQIFFDISKSNKYFYCIAWADSKWYVKWYDSWTKCENWTFRDWEKPFCPNNTIILEEALAIILRASWILTNSQADIIRTQIANWQITQKLSDDVSPKNLDGSIYSFYPDFQKALDYELLEYDKNWNEKIYKMVEVVDWKLRPKNPVKKEDFIKIAYIALKSNSCSLKKEEDLWLEMQIFNKSCNENNKDSCQRANLTWIEKVFDFYWNISLPVWETITWTDSYIWRFYNKNTWEEFKRYGEYIDNYDFLVNWDYRVFLRVVSDSWKTAEVFNDINISNQDTKDNYKLSIKADPISWNSPLVVNFTSIFSWNNSSSFFWDFWDGNSSYWNNVTHIYKEPWIYTVILTVRDQNWELYESKVIIYVYDNFLFDTDKDWVLDKDDNQINTPQDKILYICTQSDIDKKLYNCKTQDTLWVYSEDKENFVIWDYDNDKINNLDDLCPTVKWLEINKWCPVFDTLCSLDKDCNQWYYCNSWVCSPKQISPNCEYSWWDLILWNIICNSCPCNNFVDFNASLRKCDVVFPAIVSPDKATIYSKWRFFQVK